MLSEASVQTVPDILSSLPPPVQRNSTSHHQLNTQYGREGSSKTTSSVGYKSLPPYLTERMSNNQNRQHHQGNNFGSNNNASNRNMEARLQKSKSDTDHKTLNVTDLASRLRRTSLHLQSKDNQSTLTQVTKLDDTADSSLLTVDETFFERHRKPVARSVFHDSDISTISTDTIRWSSEPSTRNQSLDICADDNIPNQTRKDQDVLGTVVSNNIERRRQNVVHVTSKNHDLSQNDTQKCSNGNLGSQLTGAGFPEERPVKRNYRDKENTPSPDAKVDALWDEVRACSHARQRFRDKTNILDTAFCGRESVNSLYSDASTVDYVYKDRENGIALIERHLPSLCGSAGSRRSLDSIRSVASQNSSQGSQNLDFSQDTVLYDWKANKAICTDNSDTNSVIRMKLCSIGDDPGPITKTTRQTYLRRLSQIENDPDKKLLTKKTPGKK